jgi:hypothetical protein
MDTTELQVQIDREKVATILARFALPPEIESLETRFGNDHTGDSAVYLTFNVRDDAKLEQADIKRLSAFLAEVASALINGNIGGFAYTRLDQAA